MATAAGTISQISYVNEVTYGTTPGTPQMINVPVVSFDVSPNTATFSDDSIQSDRQDRFFRHGNKAVGGSLGFNLRHGQYDDFFKSLMGADWSSNVIKLGNNLYSMSIEEGHADITQYIVYTGMVVDAFEFSMATENTSDCSFTMLGKGMTVGTTPLDATPTAVQTKNPFVHIDGTFSEGGAGSSLLKAIKLSVKNNYQQNFVLGSSSTHSITPGQISVDGTLTALFENATILNKCLNETESSITVSLTVDSNSFTIALPKLKYGNVKKAIKGNDPIMLEMDFKAYYSSGDATTISITRSA